MPHKHEYLVFLDENWWEANYYPTKILNQKFATVLSDEDFSNKDAHKYKGFKVRPRMPASVKASGSSEVEIGKDGFEISFELDDFELGDLKVKTIDRSVVVHGKHEEKRDQYGLVSREFHRLILVPKNCDVKAVTVTFSADKKLKIKAPLDLNGNGMFNVPRYVPVTVRQYNRPIMEIAEEVIETAQKMANDDFEKPVTKPVAENIGSMNDLFVETRNKYCVTDESATMPPSVLVSQETEHAIQS